jgi:hypothetical protein
MRSYLILLTIVSLLVYSTTLLAVHTYYVREDEEIQYYLDLAEPGDTVKVLNGTFSGSGNRDLDFNSTNIVLISENGPEFTTIDCQGDSLNPRRGLYFHNGENDSSIVSGFTIINGYETYGGGIFCKSSSPRIYGNVIKGNRAISKGGGIFCELSSPTITYNTIEENSSNYGGGVYSFFSSGTLANNIIKGNWTTGGGMGGAIFCDSSSIEITHNAIGENSSEFGAGICCAYPSSPIILGNIIEKNVSANNSGGGILCILSSSPIISGNIIKRNSATYGGGIHCASSPEISNNFIVKNSATYGGGINCTSSSPSINNNTIANNSAPRGAGIYCHSLSSVSINNTIFWGDSLGDEIYLGSYEFPSTLTINYSDVNSGTTSVFVEENCILNWGEEIIESDPLFKSPEQDNYHLRASSPCRNAGDPDYNGQDEKDIDGQDRIIYGRIDIGADEYFLELKVREGGPGPVIIDTDFIEGGTYTID